MAILANYIDNEEEEEEEGREAGGVGGGGRRPLKHNCCLRQDWPIASLSAEAHVK